MWSRESEYAAWTLVNGYALNHTTVSVHRLGSLHKIGKLNEFLQENGIRLNSEGGILKGNSLITFLNWKTHMLLQHWWSHYAGDDSINLTLNCSFFGCWQSVQMVVYSKVHQWPTQSHSHLQVAKWREYLHHILSLLSDLCYPSTVICIPMRWFLEKLNNTCIFVNYFCNPNSKFMYRSSSK